MLHHDRHHEGDWAVVVCQCGTYRLKLGAVMLEFDRDEFLRLQELLNRAAEHFEAQASPLAASCPPERVN